MKGEGGRRKGGERKERRENEGVRSGVEVERERESPSAEC